MRRRTILVSLGVVILGGLGIAYFAVIRPVLREKREREAWERHQAAMERWPQLAAKKFQDNDPEVGETFYKCFRVGDPVSKYTTQLATADQTGGEFFWEWEATYGRYRCILRASVTYK